LLTVTNVSKRYGAKLALDQVSFKVSRGEIVGFLGTNGAGKTTMMNIITGYISATSGSVTVDGHDILEEPSEVKSRIGYLPEIPPIYPDFTVEENLNFCYDLKKVKLERRPHLDDICERVSIQHVRGRLARNLSMGYKQRVGIALALMGDPPMLILDEPTVGLDPLQIVEIRNLIKTLADTRTVILSSHILQEIQAVCSRIIVIHNGRLVADDTAENLIRRMQNPVPTVRFKLAGDIDANRRALESIPGVLTVSAEALEDGLGAYTLETERPDTCRNLFFMQAGDQRLPLVELYNARLTLEDAFIALTEASEAEERAALARKVKPAEEVLP